MRRAHRLLLAFAVFLFATSKVQAGSLIKSFLLLSNSATGSAVQVFSGQLLQESSISMIILDVDRAKGSVRQIDLGVRSGVISIQWDGRNDSGAAVQGGRYLAVLRALRSGEVDQVFNWVFVSQETPPAGPSASGQLGLVSNLSIAPSVVVPNQGALSIAYDLSSDADVEYLISNARSGRSIYRSPSEHVVKGNHQVVLSSELAGMGVGTMSLLVSATTGGRNAIIRGQFVSESPHKGLGGGGGATPVTAGAPAGSHGSGSGSLSEGQPSGSSQSDGHNDNGVRDHGQGSGRDGHGQGKGQGTGPQK